MKFSLLSNAFFVCVVLANKAVVHCSPRVKANSKSSSKTKDEPNYASLAKVAFESDDPSFYKKSSKHDYSSLVKLAYELEYLSNLKTTSEKNNFAALSKLAFESDVTSFPESSSKKPDSGSEQFKELFEKLKFFTTSTTTMFHNAKAGTLHLSFSDELTLLKDDQYNVEKQLNLVDFYFRPIYNCELVTYNDVTVWKKGDSDVNVPTSVTFDMDENQLVVRDRARHATYNKMADGSWRLVSLEVLDTNQLYYNPLYSELSEVPKLPLAGPLPQNLFVDLMLMAKALNIYTVHADNLIMTNNLEAYDMERIGKFNSIYVFKFRPDTKCVGVEYQGKNIWSREENDHTPLLEDGYTKDYPQRVLFNVRSSAVYVMFKDAHFVCVRQLKGFYLFRVNTLQIKLV